MKLFSTIALSCLLFSSTTSITALPFINKEESFQAIDTSNSIANDTIPVLISNQFSFTEGPAVDKNGNIFFTDQPNNKIWKYATDGKLSVFLDNAGRSNGLYFDKNGNLISCADENNELWSIKPSGEKIVLQKHPGDSLFNGPNDLWVSPTGNIYFTDPYYQRLYWKTIQPHINGQHVYLITKNKNQLIVVANDLTKPNGIIGTPDGKQLYVADIGANKTYRYNINPDGMLSDKTLFTAQGSDGMTIDNEGNIYLTGNGVTVYNNAGKKILHIPVNQPWTANVCFGGADKNILFITASTAVYTLSMKVKGVQ